LWRRSGGTPPISLILYGGLVAVMLAANSALVAAAAATNSGGGVGGCPHPAVPSGASYVNVSGGLGADSWRIKYDCDIGMIFKKWTRSLLILPFSLPSRNRSLAAFRLRLRHQQNNAAPWSPCGSASVCNTVNGRIRIKIP
jgi:hypothetical protein